MKTAILYILVIAMALHAINDEIKKRRFNKLVEELKNKDVIDTID